SLLRQYYSHNGAHDVHGAAGEAQVGVVGRIEYEIQPKECDPEAANHRHFYRVITHMEFHQCTVHPTVQQPYSTVHRTPRRAKMSRIVGNLTNLAQRPPKPAQGRGRIQRMARRLFIVGATVTTRQLCEWAYCEGLLLNGKRLKPDDYRHCRRALVSLGAKAIGRGAGRGRAMRWS